MMHFGLSQLPGGRVGDDATVGISDQLREYGFNVLRLKTGTPARLDGRTIDWDRTERQVGDSQFYPFSFRSPRQFQLPQVSCFLTYTNEQTHDFIRKNLDLSPMYCGKIEGVGPRYCPSIEDKVVRFADKSRHQTFLEPEGLHTDSVYLQGMSTSLPAEIQDHFIRTIVGLERVKILKHGYAVEYDSVEPTQLRSTLETRPIKNLYLAGQVNGTSGYEEAAGQGLVAGVNAALSVLGRAPLVMRRDQSYIGVLIDDLVTKGAKEPYRMFTSRAEHRLVLREDNTLNRLEDISVELGLVDAAGRALYGEEVSLRTQLIERVKAFRILPNPENVKACREAGIGSIINPISGDELLRRPEVTFAELAQVGFSTDYPENVKEAVEIEFKYAGYVRRQEELIQQLSKMESVGIPVSFNYTPVRGLSHEEIETLNRVQPGTIGQASRISGVTPSAVQALVIYLKTASRNEILKFNG
jgi:tRNA uridine 5-carboxymethylaminomethyl modification enzyme